LYSVKLWGLGLEEEPPHPAVLTFLECCPLGRDKMARLILGMALAPKAILVVLWQTLVN